jgi:hypothetical protein
MARRLIFDFFGTLVTYRNGPVIRLNVPEPNCCGMGWTWRLTSLPDHLPSVLPNSNGAPGRRCRNTDAGVAEPHWLAHLYQLSERLNG